MVAKRKSGGDRFVLSSWFPTCLVFVHCEKAHGDGVAGVEKTWASVDRLHTVLGMCVMGSVQGIDDYSV